MLKVSPWRGVIRFRKRRKLSPRFIGPFKVIERIGPVAYKLKLPNKFHGIHDTFHVSNLKRCFVNDDVVIPLDEVQLDDKLYFVEEPVEIMDREVIKDDGRFRVLEDGLAWFKFELILTMTTANQGMSIEEIEQIVAQRVANAIEAIAIYETKTSMAREAVSQTERHVDKATENASNKRKWEVDHNGSSSQQQNKEHKVFRAHTARPSNKKEYAGILPLCNK
nr:putative reverse transcriptase domain-containing protein [Tanacetum cinerariifolium]